MRGAAFLLLGALAACQTNVALVDDTHGFERAHAGRIAHLRSARAPLTPHDDGHVRFVLDLALENATSTPWSLSASAVALRVVEGGPTPRLDLPADCVLATLAADTDTDVKLPVLLPLPEPGGIHDLERTPIVLTITDGSVVLLERRIVVGAYDQVGQVLRVAMIATGALLLLSLF